MDHLVNGSDGNPGTAVTVPHRAVAGGPELPLLALGSWYTYDRMDFDEVVAMLRLAVDSGITLFDVGVYGRYPQRHPLGNPRYGRTWTDVVFAHAMRVAGIARERYMTAEKIWMWAYPRLRLEQQLDHALLRLGTDHSDFVMLGDMEDAFDLGALVEEVAQLIRRGKARWWGVNNWSADELGRAHAYALAHGLPPPSLAQLKYNPARRTKAESALWCDFLARSGVRLQASDIFESGYFAGRTELTRGVARDVGGVQPLIAAASSRFSAVAAGIGATPAQLALAFCLCHPEIGNVLFGCTSRAQLRENLGALALWQREGRRLVALVEEFWFDRDRVDPAASWSAQPVELPPVVGHGHGASGAPA
ncbi:MAG: aldo/keto reductase [Ideonella sp.]|nr:aldo/keto reductase [Ideonella sp.]MCC7455580.1 aldo/keto reductase [Nitrospira sp.]